MVWARLDDQFPDHPKVVGLSDQAFRLEVAGICHSTRLLTNGVVLAGDVPRLIRGYKPKMLAELVDAGLWHPHGHDCADCPQPPENGYIIHDFLDCNPSRERVKQRREAEREKKRRQRRGADGTYEGESPGESPRDTDRDSRRASPPSRPVPPLDVDTSISNSRESAAGRGGGESQSIEDPILGAARIVAQARTAQVQSEGTVIHKPASYARSMLGSIREEHESRWRQMLKKQPDLEPEQLAKAVLNPQRAADKRVAAAWARADRHKDACEVCGGTGFDVDDEGLAIECSCRGTEKRGAA